MRSFTFASCINQSDIARRHFLASACVQPDAGHQLVLIGDARSAGDGFKTALTVAQHDWLIMVHQDVHLPPGWDQRFSKALDVALEQNPEIAVAGVYGVRSDASHVGHVYDRDRWLGQAHAGSISVASLDELLLAIRVSRDICPDPRLGWHLYGTDVCLKALAHHTQAVVLDAPCSHHSCLPRLEGALTEEERQKMREVANSFAQSAEVLLRLWPNARPIHTPVMSLMHDFSTEQIMAWIEQQ
jgi:hypothetical protein